MYFWKKRLILVLKTGFQVFLVYGKQGLKCIFENQFYAVHPTAAQSLVLIFNPYYGMRSLVKRPTQQSDIHGKSIGRRPEAG